MSGVSTPKEKWLSEKNFNVSERAHRYEQNTEKRLSGPASFHHRSFLSWRASRPHLCSLNKLVIFFVTSSVWHISAWACRRCIFVWFVLFVSERDRWGVDLCNVLKAKHRPCHAIIAIAIFISTSLGGFPLYYHYTYSIICIVYIMWNDVHGILRENTAFLCALDFAQRYIWF